jgi:hypothetical protein
MRAAASEPRCGALIDAQRAMSLASKRAPRHVRRLEESTGIRIEV